MSFFLDIPRDGCAKMGLRNVLVRAPKQLENGTPPVAVIQVMENLLHRKIIPTNTLVHVFFGGGWGVRMQNGACFNSASPN